MTRTADSPTVLLYDWDNTLVDGWAGITAALNAVFAAFAMPAWSVADTRARVRVSLRDSFPVHVRRRVGDGARHLLCRARGAAPAPRRPMPGAAEALAAGAAWPQGVVSNKAGRFLRAEVRASRLGRPFRRGGRRRRRRAPTSPTRRRSCWRSTGSAAAADRSVWYLGDTALDMQAARAAGVTAVLVGDASHDGGIDRARPDIHFPSALDLAARLRALA